MGTCGCGDFYNERAVRLGEGGPVVSFDVYTGCRDCEPMFSVDTRLFNEQGVKEWLDGAKIETVPPDEYGGNSGCGVSIPIFSVHDIVAAIKNLQEDEDSRIEHYASPAEWFEDYGLGILKDAHANCKRRLAKEDAKDKEGEGRG